MIINDDSLELPFTESHTEGDAKVPYSVEMKVAYIYSALQTVIE